MAKRTTKTEVVTKALARSGPELRPEQIRLADEAQTDPKKIYTQSDVNQNGGGNGGGGSAPDLSGYAKTDYVDSADLALNALIAALEERVSELEAKPSFEGQARTATYRLDPKIHVGEKGGCTVGPLYIAMNTFDLDDNIVELSGYTEVRFVFDDDNGNPIDETRKIKEINPHGVEGVNSGKVGFEGEADDMSTWLDGFYNPSTRNIVTMILR